MSDYIRIRLPITVTMPWSMEADGMGLTMGPLLSCDLSRLRRILTDNVPPLTSWEYDLLDHVLPDEGMEIATDPLMGERILSADSIRIAVMEWADGADEGQMLKAETLAKRVETWTPLQIWALMVKRRPRE